MRRILTLAAMAGILAALALAESWDGKLLDASCYDQQKTAKGCDATATSAAFAFEVSGKVYQLDPEGNKKTAAALKSSADRSVDPGKRAESTVNAKITGAMEGNLLKVETIEIP